MSRGTVRVWDLTTAQQRAPNLLGGHGEVLSMAVTTDGFIAISNNRDPRLGLKSGDGTARVWDLATGQLRRLPSSATRTRRARGGNHPGRGHCHHGRG